MDGHANAHIMEYADRIVTKIISSEPIHEEKEFTLQKDESFMETKCGRGAEIII
jgi:hypothetical protein